MSWSRFFRLCVLVGGVSAWTSLTVLVSQAVFARLLSHKDTDSIPLREKAVLPSVPSQIVSAAPQLEEHSPKKLLDEPKAMVQESVVQKPVISKSRKTRPTAGKLRQSVSVIVSVLLVIAIVTQALLFFHVPLINVFAAHGTNNANSASYAAPSVPQTPKTTGLRTSTFETGIVTPQWQQQTAYNAAWQQSVSDIQTQTGARWIELSLLFSQATSISTTVNVTQYNGREKLDRLVR